MGEESSNAAKRPQIEETVLQILKASELETVTEFGVRCAAAEQLGFDLSGLDHRLLVRQLVDSFLLSTAAEILRTNSFNRIPDGSGSDKGAVHRVQQRRTDVDAVSGANYDGKIICKLSDNRRVTVHDFMGATVISIRDFYVQNGNLLPVRGGSSGISLTSSQWSSFRSSVPSVEEAIVRMQSRLSESGDVTSQSEADMTNQFTEFASEKSQTAVGVSNLASSTHLPGKRKRNQSEPDMRSSASDPAEKGPARTAISNLVSTVRPHNNRERSEVDTSNALVASISQEHILAEKAHETPGTCGTTSTFSYQEQILASRTEVASQNSTLVPPLPNQLDSTAALSPNDSVSQMHSHHTSIAIPPDQLIPIQPVRFDGRNYHSWKIQMEMLLTQLSIAYVLSERCPNISLNPEASFEEMVGAKAAMQRWITDDYLCRNNILNSLCDSLFQLYSQKSSSAGELWEELKAVYNEDFGNPRSQINKYINFRMVDGVSIFDQIQELHKIVDSIIASGTWIDEYFHISVIVSKLPPSWKELRLKLMQEEFLTLNMLMHRLRVEADSHNFFNKEANCKKSRHVTEPKLDQRHRMKKDENKRACFTCGKEGHISKYCPERKLEPCDKSKGKENGFLSSCTGAKMDAADKRACFICGKDGHVSINCRNRKLEPCAKSNGEVNGSLSPPTGSKRDDAAKPK
ncbi:hypothetical protein SASPL_111454 [Salvia splendens]|uniref:Uncharacterized protein n=1 Tax=Salvia splendens TaxID=180675 RepID=A0A8X9A3D2_SALSN|nr:uncharacterized protein LOC121798837 [Salvia splendens]KAG6427212.1 hypothetical protein SASPL_111454 [Salvia splendens]